MTKGVRCVEPIFVLGLGLDFFFVLPDLTETKDITSFVWSSAFAFYVSHVCYCQWKFPTEPYATGMFHLARGFHIE